MFQEYINNVISSSESTPRPRHDYVTCQNAASRLRYNGECGNVRFLPRFQRFDGLLLSRVRPSPRFIALNGNLLPCGLSARVIGHIKNEERTTPRFRNFPAGARNNA